MDQALVEDAEDDVDHDDGGDDQHRLLPLRLLRRQRRALERAAHRRRHADVGLGLAGSPRRRRPGCWPSARLNEIVVASSPSWWLIAVGVARSTKRATALSGTIGVTVLLRALPVEESRDAGIGRHGGRRAAGGRRGGGSGRDRRAARGAGAQAPGRHVQVGERIRPLGVARMPFHDHAVLVELAVDRRHRALAEGVVEGRVDRRRAEAEARGAVAVDLDPGLDAVVLLVGVDVGHHVGLLLHLLGQPRRPQAQGRQAVALQRVLVGRAALPAAGAHVLHRVEEDLQAGHLRELRPEARDHRLAALAALGRPASG